MSSSTALKTFSLTNEILEVSPQDQIYRFDVEENKKINREAPWTKESAKPPLCTRVISDAALAAPITSNHARFLP